MQTHFTAAQLADPDTAESENVLRACVHCGFCTATCPTYVLLGDELDSPRGRIYLIRDMLENDKPATAPVVKHIDRCLSCLACMSTCPSGVNYMHLIDHARHHIERTYRRPWQDRALRALLGFVLPRPAVFRVALMGAAAARPLAPLLPPRLAAMLRLAPWGRKEARRGLRPSTPLGGDPPDPHSSERDEVLPGTRRSRGTGGLGGLPPMGVEGAKPLAFLPARPRRIALLTGCAQRVLAPQINEATIRLLTRHGCEVVVPRGAGCCGALNHHLGQDGAGFARANIAAWSREMAGEGLDAIVINASGCGTTVKEYGFTFRVDPLLAEPARKVSAIARDISELMTEIGLQPPAPGFAGRGLRVAYHSACSLQHGQRVRGEPKALLHQAGFTVLDVPEGHLCCGSAGTYNLLQPEIAGALRERKVANIESTVPDLIAAGNIGCITQIAAGTALPIVHTVELLDWATGGPKPESLPD